VLMTPTTKATAKNQYFRENKFKDAPLER